MESARAGNSHGSGGPIQSVARAISLLQCFVDGPESISLTELAQRTDVNISTAHRLLQTLCAGGLLGRDRHGERYVRGPVLLALAQSAFSAAGLGDALQIIETLTKDTGESASLGIRSDDCVVVVLAAQPNDPLRFERPPGTRVPVLPSAMGRSLLAHDTVTATRLLARAGASLSGATQEQVALTHALEQVREEGYAYVDEEQFVGVRAIAAPVFDSSGAACAAVGIQGPTSRISDDRIEELAKAVRAAAALVGELPSLDRLAPRLG